MVMSKKKSPPSKRIERTTTASPYCINTSTAVGVISQHTMPPTIVSSRRSKGPRALANVTSSALNSRNFGGNGGGKHGTKRSCKKNEQGESINTDDATIDEIGRRMTRSMTLASSASTTNDLSKKPSSRRVRRLAPPDRSTMRTTRSMALRDKRLTASLISIDTIANIATYLQPNNDAMNVCLAVGPEAAQIVRTRYLLHREGGHWSKSSTSFLFSAVTDFDLSRKRRSWMAYEWMLVNKDKCRAWLLYGRDFRFAPLLVARNETTLTFSLASIYANPGIAVAMGWTFLVALHFEREDFDVNGLYNYGDVDIGREEGRYHLITTAIASDHVKVFKLLLAHPRIELSCTKTLEDPRRHPLFFALFSKSSNKAYFLRKVVTHRSFNVNEPIRLKDGHMVPPLLCVTSCYISLEPTESPPLWALEILVEAGADVHLEVENMLSPYNAMLRAASVFIQERLEDCTADEIKHFIEALTVMEKWPASMKINGLVRGFLTRRRLAAVTRR